MQQGGSNDCSDMEMSQGSPKQRKEKEDKSDCTAHLVALDGEIGVQKANYFVAYTNFTVKVIGVVERTNGVVDGYMTEVCTKDMSNKCEQPYFITMRDIFTQNGILGVLGSSRLWTRPSREQYLPMYFKMLCEEYRQLPDRKRLYPVTEFGLHTYRHQGANRNLWILSGNVQLVEEGGSDLDNGEALVAILQIQERVVGKNNTISTILMLGGICLGIHYSTLDMDVPPVLALGHQVSGKSRAMEVGMALLGMLESVGGCTEAGMLKLLEESKMPIFWDDCDDPAILEKVTVHVFNKVQRVVKNSMSKAQTTHIVTMNPDSLKLDRLGKEKIARFFSRLGVIPFLNVEDKMPLADAMSQEKDFRTALKKVHKSASVILTLHDELQNAVNNDWWATVTTMVDESMLAKMYDIRTKSNYVLLFFAATLIIEKCGMDVDGFHTDLSTWVTQLLTPCLVECRGAEQSAQVDDDEGNKVLSLLLEKALHDITKAKTFMLLATNVVSRTKKSGTRCQCKKAMAIYVPGAVEFLLQCGAIKSEMDSKCALKALAEKSDKACARVKVNLPHRQVWGCHYSHDILPVQLLEKLKDAWYTSGEQQPSLHESNGTAAGKIQHLPLSAGGAKPVSDCTGFLVTESATKELTEEEMAEVHFIMDLEESKNDAEEGSDICIVQDQHEECTKQANSESKPRKKGKLETQSQLSDGLTAYFQPSRPRRPKEK
eukprot:gene2582-2981_t